MTDRLAEQGAVQYAQNKPTSTGVSRLGGAGYLQAAISDALSNGRASASAYRVGGKGRIYALAASAGPLFLFQHSEVGAWLDPSDFSTMYQDSAGTTPVTAVGQVVGRIEDKSGNGFHATQATTASKPILQQDASGNYYLAFDGVDDYLVTGSIDFTGTDKLGVFLKVHRQLNAAVEVICELSANAGTNAGAFFVAGDVSAGYRVQVSGDTSNAQFVYPTSIAPQTDVVVAEYDLSAIVGLDEISVKIDGLSAPVTSTISVGPAGGGNFGNYQLYLGMRGGVQFPFSGRLYGAIVRGAASTANEVLAAENGVGLVRPPTSADVFIIAGQSNATSRAAFDSGDDWKDGVWQLGRHNYDGELIGAARPLDHWTQPQAGGMGWALQFVLDYKTANPNRNVVLIPAAEGGTSFVGNHWNPGNSHYEDMVARANTLFSEHLDYTLKAILWHQGESDDNNATYETQLDAALAGFRTDITAANSATPIILGELAPEWVGIDVSRLAIQAIITDTPNRVASTAVASSSGLTTFDGTHFNAASYRTLGSRYYSTWVAIA